MALMFLGCQTTDPPPAETVLRLHLNDSLSRYDSVVVRLLDRTDTTKVIAVLHKGALRNPANEIIGYPLGSLAGKPFAVKVMGYRPANQLALETFIFYDVNSKMVLHNPVPQAKPQDWLIKLQPSVGGMIPAFDKDSLFYNVTLPVGTTAVTISQQAAFKDAVVTINGQLVAFGASSKPMSVGNAPDTVRVQVTDVSSGKTSTRSYTLVLLPSAPAGVFLASLQPSVGNLSPNFQQQTSDYILELPPGIDTVSFRAAPTDLNTMTLTIGGQAISANVKSKIFTVIDGRLETVQFEVIRGTARNKYQVTIVNL